jgi:hypothetical protein
MWGSGAMNALGFAYNAESTAFKVGAAALGRLEARAGQVVGTCLDKGVEIGALIKLPR